MSKPITSWRAAARVLGISEDTLGRRRRHYKDRTLEPWWESEEEVRLWYRTLIAPPVAPLPSPAQGRKAKPPKAFDADALRRELIR